jgi:hypothetical protein
MTTYAFTDLMAKRMAVVERLSALSSKQLLYTQKRSGIEVELLGCIDDIGREGETATILARRADLECRLTAMTVAIAECERERDVLTSELDALEEATMAS